MPKTKTAQKRRTLKKHSLKVNAGRKVVLEQWVEVRIRNGKTITELTPSNERLLQQSRAMEFAPELVYRRLNFPEGVPEEYNWTEPDENTRRYGGGGVQRMTLATWIELSRSEDESGTGHIRETGSGNLPRPREHGGCECALCSENERRLGLRH